MTINADEYGNELRFLNYSTDSETDSNVTMRVAYVATYPHLVVVCTKDVEIGDELVLDHRQNENLVEKLLCFCSK